MIDATHDPARKSWITAANADNCDFPIQNLPYGVFSTPGTTPRVGIAIGNLILDLAALEVAGLVAPNADARVFDAGNVNAFMALGPGAWRTTRTAISALLEASNGRLRDDSELKARALVPMSEAKLHLPLYVRSFTDFYASKEHATNVGSMFRDPANALMPNWLHIPIGYNGRASTVVVSGTDVRRPLGQTKPANATEPLFGPCQRLDFELELGAVVGTPNTMSMPITTSQAYDMIFGYVLLNDWSARDIQAWEYQPLGPFQAKAFATSISPWIVTRDALEPFRVPAPEPVKPLLPYLRERAPNNFDINLEVSLRPEVAGSATTISRTNYKNMYYSAAQQLAHHAVGGCAMCTGDLIGSGTVSGRTKDSLGSLLELAWGGKEPIALSGGEKRAFLADGDTVTFQGWCQGQGYRVGFGECAGKVLPAIEQPQW
ncbi:MAG: fumarylacetoacetase [Sphingomonadales bacterium]|nr:fumarylacetoacetase [Sphingomonadales bacterium]